MILDLQVTNTELITETSTGGSLGSSDHENGRVCSPEGYGAGKEQSQDPEFRKTQF